MMYRSFSFAAAVAVSSVLIAQPTTSPSTDTDDARVRAFVTAMRFSDEEKTRQVDSFTAGYVRELRGVLGRREAALKAVPADAPAAKRRSADIWREGRSEAVKLRDALVKELNGLLTPFQVERIKDGLTHELFNKTAQIYDEMVPGLSHVERAHVLGLLTEMRENALLEADLGPQEKWTAKYRGIINNFISKQGHDFAALSKAFDEKKTAAKKK